MNKFEWGNLNKPGIYFNEDNRRITYHYRNIFTSLAEQLVEENKIDSAIAVLDRVVEMLPEENIPYGVSNMFIAEVYYDAAKALKNNDEVNVDYNGQSKEVYEKANAIFNRLLELKNQNLNYYFSFRGARANLIERDKNQAIGIIQRIQHMAERHEQDEVFAKAKEIFDTYYEYYMRGY